MVKILKYVVSSQNVPILFNSDVSHSYVANQVSSAGFVIVNYDLEKEFFHVKCYGQSLTLGIGSNINDSVLIQNYLNK